MRRGLAMAVDGTVRDVRVPRAGYPVPRALDGRRARGHQAERDHLLVEVVALKGQRVRLVWDRQPRAIAIDRDAGAAGRC